ncbi:hypothetical protein DL96DRAFT_1560950 [Flagelloscypha sp. PMI_526]|nr:hypothetical protein DL96DRAFT_1560950 [Flagelloscypha sp. PMI_526]
MPPAKASSHQTQRAAGTGVIDFPFELWEVVLGDMSKHQLWKIRSLNRSVYSFAARAMYGSISLAPRSKMPGSAHDILERMCDTTLQISGLVHTIHLHSNFEAYASQKALARSNANNLLDTAVLMNSRLKVFNLTIHCDMWVRFYVGLTWQKFADDIVHLELRFFTSSVLRAIPQNVYCRNLKSFVLTCGAGPFRWNKLRSLSLHSLSDSDGFWTLDPSFLLPNAFPHLKKLHLSSHSIDCDPVLLPFLLSHVAPSPLQDLVLSRNLQELFLTYKIFCDMFSLRRYWPGSATGISQSCPSLRRLGIGECIEPNQAFYILLELARGEMQVEQLNLCVSGLNLRLFRAALLLLPRLSHLILANVHYEPDFVNLSTRMKLWTMISWRSPRSFHFTGLSNAATRLGRQVREAMVKELRNDIEFFYQIKSWPVQKRVIFFSSVKKALNAAKEQVGGNWRVKVTTNDHEQATIQLVEDCLVNAD